MTVPRTAAPTGAQKSLRAATFATNRAQRDYYRSLIAELPDPEEYARYVPEAICAALLRAFKHQSYGYLIAEEDAHLLPELRKRGLAGFPQPHVARSGRGVTAFGWKVREALLREETN